MCIYIIVPKPWSLTMDHMLGNRGILIDWLIDFIYIKGKPEKAAIAYLTGDLKYKPTPNTYFTNNISTLMGASIVTRVISTGYHRCKMNIQEMIHKYNDILDSVYTKYHIYYWDSGHNVNMFFISIWHLLSIFYTNLTLSQLLLYMSRKYILHSD